MPHGVGARGSATELILSQRVRMNRSGIWNNRPQPSPVLPSAAMPPRWVMQVSDSMAVCSRRWLTSPSRMGYQSESAIVAEFFRSMQACAHSQSRNLQ